MKDCVFCKIVQGEFDSAKIWENEQFLAFLDINPNSKGVTLVASKKHYPAYLFNLDDELCKNFILAAKKVVKVLEKGLGVKRVGLAMEGMGIDHVHLKLYPFYRTEEWDGDIPEQRIFLERYEGRLTTRLGPQVPLEELKKLAREIKQRNL
jgi:diadenosine tetraphosphate (Ap4A) HIT family hydrolase